MAKHELNRAAVFSHFSQDRCDGVTKALQRSSRLYRTVFFKCLFEFVPVGAEAVIGPRLSDYQDERWGYRQSNAPG
jgi:hypothetical protein